LLQQPLQLVQLRGAQHAEPLGDAAEDLAMAQDRPIRAPAGGQVLLERELLVERRRLGRRGAPVGAQ
jgi:hypothetical protein